MTGLCVEKPGVLSLLLDKGRFGQHQLGLTNGGPLDLSAFLWANRLLSNCDNATVIEISLGGLTLKSQVNSTISLTGADMPLLINGTEVPRWQNHPVAIGDSIDVGYANQGRCCYLAIKNGFNVPPVFNSTSTVIRESIGGLDGKQLKNADVLPCDNTETIKSRKVPVEYQTKYSPDIVLNVILAYQQHTFSAIEQQRFFNSHYQVSQKSDRMGCRLTGAKILSNTTQMLSEGICLGAIQIPADGQPIILLQDRQTIGGYPKIGAVLSLDLPKLGQASPGDTVRFNPITIHEAHNRISLARARDKNVILEAV